MQLCACGCGLPTSLITRSNRWNGDVAGTYRRYVVGHGNRKPAPTVDGILANTKRSDLTGCLEWLGVTTSGYGSICVLRKKVNVHRLIYILLHGPIPHGLQVRHKCDNRKCCNPEHLELGTIADNMKDKADRGRALKGERHHSAKLNPESVRFIRSSRDTSAGLARQFNVSERAITFVRTGRNWKHVV